MKKATKQKNRAAVKFPASRAPQKVLRLERVRDVDTGQFGTVIKRDVEGSGKVKVRWDNRDKPTLIDADQLAKANPKQRRYLFARHSANPKHRSGDQHVLITKSLLNPTHGVCSCGRFDLKVQLAKGATAFGAQEYLAKWHGDHIKLEKRVAHRKAVAAKNPKARAAAKSPRRPAASSKSPSRSRKANPQKRFSKATLAHLRKEFAKIDGATLAKHQAQFDKVFAQTSRPLLKQLAEAKIEWVSEAAKNALVARRNPGMLEAGANIAAILGGLERVRKMMKGGSKKKRSTKKKPNSPRAGSAKSSKKKTKNLGLLDVAANLQAADYLRKALSSKKKKKANSQKTAKRSVTRRPNPNDGRIFREFTGSPSKNVLTGFRGHMSEPTRVDQLGTLTEIKLGNLSSGPILRFPLGTKTNAAGQRVFVFSNSLVDERGKAINPKRIHRVANPTILCAKEIGNGRRRFVVASKQPLVLQNGKQAGKVLNYGMVVQLSYRAPKPHLHDGDKRVHEFYHNLGEEGGRQPQLKLDNGWWRFHGGDYKIRQEGIRD